MDLQFANAWETVADVVPEHTAIVQGDRRYSYREFDDLSSRFASALGAAGVSESAAVGLYLYNSPEYLIAQAGSFKHRAVPINVNFRYLDDELAYLIDNAAQMEQGWFTDVQTVGLTAGASAPEVLISEVVARLREWGGNLPEEVPGRAENMVFSMPKELRPA